MTKTVTNEAINGVKTAVDPAWLKAADRAVRRVAKKHPTFTTDEVWAALKRSKATTTERRAMGAVMRKAAAEGIIESTKTYQVSTRPECHRRPITVWASIG